MQQNRVQTALSAGFALLLFILFCGLSGYFLNPWSTRQSSQIEQEPPPDWSNLDASLGLRPVDGATVIPLTQVTVQLQGETSTINSSDLYARQVVQTRTDTGAIAYVVEYDQIGANALVNQLWQEYATAETRSSMRNPSVDLQNGTVVFLAEAGTPLGWQDIAVTLDFDEQGTAFNVGSVTMGGLTFTASSVPEPLAGMLTQLEQEGNAALQTAVFVDTSGQLTIDQIYIADGVLRMIAN